MGQNSRMLTMGSGIKGGLQMIVRHLNPPNGQLWIQNPDLGSQNFRNRRSRHNVDCHSHNCPRSELCDLDLGYGCWLRDLLRPPPWAPWGSRCDGGWGSAYCLERHFLSKCPILWHTRHCFPEAGHSAREL